MVTAAMMATAIVIAALSGCSLKNGALVSPSTNPTVNLAAAKAEAMRMENEISQLIPERFVDGRRQLDEVPLLDCDGHSGLFTWPGHSTVILSGEADKLALIQLIAVHWRNSPYFKVEVDTQFDGEPGLKIEGKNDAATYFVDFQNSGRELKIHSFSSCFALPEANNGGNY